jgi:hypothetical protein
MRALRSGWEIPADRRAKLVERLMTLALDPSTTPSMTAKIGRTLVAMDSVSIRSAETTIAALTAAEMAGRLAQLEEQVNGLDGSGPGPAGGPRS